MEHILLNVFSYDMTSVLLVLPIHCSIEEWVVGLCVCVWEKGGGGGGVGVES